MVLEDNFWRICFSELTSSVSLCAACRKMRGFFYCLFVTRQNAPAAKMQKSVTRLFGYRTRSEKIHPPPKKKKNSKLLSYNMFPCDYQSHTLFPPLSTTMQ